ncbi:MAG TPA: adenosine deaminase [Roseiflexaceae bacterium]
MQAINILTPALDRLITRMPKAELHLHLEGSITPRTFLELAQRNRVDIPADDEAGVTRLFRYQRFHEFLGTFMLLSQALVHGEDFAQAAYELGLHLKRQNTRYAEVMLSPALHYRRGIDLDEMVRGAADGFARAQRAGGPQVNLVFDYGRQNGVALAWQILDVAIRNMRHGVVAWSIGGDEVQHPPEPFADVFAAARRAGLHVMAHAGEVAGPESVRGAVEALGAERVGHGIRSIDDPALLALLRDRNVTLDVCPSSNVLTNAVASLAMHPLRRLVASGVRVTLNTDDPTFFHTTLNDEYRLAAREFGFNADELILLALNSVRASFLPEREKRALLRQFTVEIAGLLFAGITSPRSERRTTSIGGQRLLSAKAA